MSRGLLSEAGLREIAGRLPDLSVVEGLIHPFSPEAVATVFPHESTVPVACVCLADVLQTLYAVRYALHEFFAHARWYREQDPPNESAAVFFERYYLDDAAFRLYNAGEDLASALQNMHGLTSQDLAAYRAPWTSLQATVGKYLVAQRPAEPVSVAVRKLATLKEWGDVVAYRNLVVHEQAPSMGGTGLVYERRPRWAKEGDSWVLGIGGGDRPLLTTARLGETVQVATRAFVDAVVATATAYRDLLAGTGRVRFDEGRMSVPTG